MPFSTSELDILKDFTVKQPAYLPASDGIKLVYYSYVPDKPEACLIFYHGAGFYSSALYQYFAKQLAEDYNIGCYLFDIRGHGHSEGTRGDAPHFIQVLNDVATATLFVRNAHPGVPIYLGGHSSGGGLVLNYIKYSKIRKNMALSYIDGYVLIAPYLGRDSGVLKEHSTVDTAFVKEVKVWVFILNGISYGYLFSHTPAVFFNYPAKLVDKYPLIVPSYTPTMMAATSPESPRNIFAKLTTKPLALFAAENDEQFEAQKLIEYKNSIPNIYSRLSIAKIVPDTKHLDIMLHSAGDCAAFIKKTNKQ
ncbi:alpha/beta fold hydrolase [Candidatus Dependentiae bacterium]|nr:alpha/beta fold hydrolase [Candidatus Dependentiae bacterium]